MGRVDRRGMTLIESLVLVAVVGLVVALAVPALQAARAAARRASCVQNLGQMGLALLNYASANEVLPMSRTVGEGHGNETSSFTSLLPYLERGALYNAYNFSLENWHVTNETAVRTTVETFLCPDNPDTESVPAWEVRYAEGRGKFAKAHYGVNWGGGHGPWGEDFVKEKGTYLGVMMAVITPEGRDKARDGRPRARNISVADITDGTAFTLAVVEKRDSFGWAVGGWGGSEFDVYTTPAYQGDDPLARKVYTGSPHANGPNALFCDASVRTLPARQDKKIWYRLITRAGGEAVRFADAPLGRVDQQGLFLVPNPERKN
jgi:prepilin-type processing-associated H-X9-DG protein